MGIAGIPRNPRESCGVGKLETNVARFPWVGMGVIFVPVQASLPDMNSEVVFSEVKVRL